MHDAGCLIVFPKSTFIMYFFSSLDCPNGYVAYDLACYKSFITSGVTWYEAEARCLEDKANLASIHSLEENEFIYGKTIVFYFYPCLSTINQPYQSINVSYV